MSNYMSAYSGQTDTEYILASVKEQEMQFERLTKELEEEHHTVANQLQRCRIQSNAERYPISESENQEGSDTESKQGSLHDGELKESVPINDVDTHRVSSAPAHIYKQSEVETDYARSVPHQRSSPIKISRPQSSSFGTDLRDVKSPVEHVHQSPVAYPRPYYANPHYRMQMPEQPPFPTYFSPPIYQPVYQYYPQSSLIPPHQSHFSYHQPVPIHHPHQFNHSHHEHHLHHAGWPVSTNHHNIPSHNHGPHSTYRLLTSPVKNVSTHPPIPPKSPFLQHQTLSEFPTHHQPTSTSYTTYHSQDLKNPSPVRTRKYTPESYPQAPVYNFQNENTSHHDHIIPPPSYMESTPAPNIPPKVPPRDHADHRRRSQVLPTSSRTTISSFHSPRSPHRHEDVTFFPERDPEVVEVIQMLRHPSYQVVSNAAAYIQHITYGDDKMKTIIRKHGVLPLLVNLLHHHVIDVQQNACGALRNMVYGRQNDEAKMIVRNCGGVSSLSHVLRNTEDQDMKEMITGVLWNLSSCEHLKMTITDSAMPVLASRIIIHYVSMLEPSRMSMFSPHPPGDPSTLTSSDLTIDPHWSTLFINATGCLRNISSAGVEIRKKLRSYDGLVEALLLVVENVIGKSDVDSKGVENCMCILRNLSYRLALEVEAAHVPLTRNTDVVSTTKDEDCWKRSKRKHKRRSKDVEVLLNVSPSRSATQVEVHGVELLWQPGIVRRYLALLADTYNFGTLEAATGALQNLSAGQWVWSANIRTAVRKEKGLPMLVEFLHMDNERIVTVMCSTLRNMALDQRNKQLIGKHAMKDLVDLLPDIDFKPRDDQGLVTLDELQPLLTNQKLLLYEAVCSALKELVTADNDNAALLYNIGGVSKLIEISRGDSYRYPHRIEKAAGRVLSVLWEYKNLRTAFKQQGWTQYHFNMSGVPSIASVGSQVSPISSPPLSPDESYSFKEQQSPPAYSRVQMQVSSRQSTRSPYSHPHLPYAPMASHHPKTPYYSPQPDSNYVMMIKKNNSGVILKDSWV